MKSMQPLMRILATASLLPSVALPLAAQTVTQSLTLHPGWNAVWLEVQPEDNAADVVFSHLPVASAWTRLERLSPVDFIQSASEEAFNEAGWPRWFPAAREESFLNTLFAVQANRAYLLLCTNTAPVVWHLTGRPSLRQPAWVPGAFNLRGLPVDPSAPPSFVNFFRASPAHYHSASGQLQTAYRLHSASGEWLAVAPTDPVQSGVAYWIFTQGASDYLAPLNVAVDLGDGLDFGVDLSELDLKLKNQRTGPVNALLVEPGTSNSILSHYTFDPVLGGAWSPLPSPLPVGLDGGAETTIRLGARRQDLSDPVQELVLEVRDGAGTRVLVPVRV